MVCTHAPLSYYAFDCDSCGCEVRKPADDHVVSLLVSGGVPATVWDLPAESLEPKSGPVLSYDDLLDFALQLGETDLLASKVDRARRLGSGHALGPRRHPDRRPRAARPRLRSPSPAVHGT